MMDDELSLVAQLPDGPEGYIFVTNGGCKVSPSDICRIAAPEEIDESYQDCSIRYQTSTIQKDTGREGIVVIALYGNGILKLKKKDREKYKHILKRLVQDGILESPLKPINGFAESIKFSTELESIKSSLVGTKEVDQEKAALVTSRWNDGYWQGLAHGLALAGVCSLAALLIYKMPNPAESSFSENETPPFSAEKSNPESVSFAAKPDNATANSIAVSSGESDESPTSLKLYRLLVGVIVLDPPMDSEKFRQEFNKLKNSFPESEFEKAVNKLAHEEGVPAEMIRAKIGDILNQSKVSRAVELVEKISQIIGTETTDFRKLVSKIRKAVNDSNINDDVLASQIKNIAKRIEDWGMRGGSVSLNVKEISAPTAVSIVLNSEQLRKGSTFELRTNGNLKSHVEKAQLQFPASGAGGRSKVERRDVKIVFDSLRPVHEKRTSSANVVSHSELGFGKIKIEYEFKKPVWFMEFEVIQKQHIDIAPTKILE